METKAKSFNCPVEDDREILTSLERAKNKSRYSIKIFPEKPDQGGITVFLIDDDLMYLIAMEHYLSQEIPSLKIRTFQTGESALFQIDQHPDVVVLDYFLDSKDPSAENGISILKKIKEKSPGTKVVMLSYQEKIKVAMSSVKLGAYDYVFKGDGAFLIIKNILVNVTANAHFTSSIKSHSKILKFLNLIVFILMILFYLLSH